MLGMAGNDVTGVDYNQDAIAWANEYFPGPKYICGRVEEVEGQFDTVVSLETIEHIKEPGTVIKALRAACKGELIASVPNEDDYPFVAANFANDESPHYRHYRPKEFEDLLNEYGFKVVERFYQKDKASPEVRAGTGGKFLVYVCV